MKTQQKHLKRHISKIITVPIIFMVLSLALLVTFIFFFNRIEQAYLRYIILGSIVVIFVASCISLYIRSRQVFTLIKNSLELMQTQIEKLQNDNYVRTSEEVNVVEVQNILDSCNNLIDSLSKKVYIEKPIELDEKSLVKDRILDVYKFDSFKKICDSYLTQNGLFRVALLAFEIKGNKDRYISSIINEVKRDISYVALGIDENKILYVLVKGVNSLSILKASCEYIVSNFNKLNTKSESKEIEVSTVKVAGAIYPYTSREEIFDVTKKALEEDKLVNIIKVNKRMSDLSLRVNLTSEQKKFMTGLEILESLYKEMNTVGSNLEISNIVERYLTSLCKMMHFDCAGYMFYDPARDVFWTKYEYQANEDDVKCSVRKYGDIKKSSLGEYLKLFDDDGSFYGNTTLDLPSTVKNFFTSLGIKSFYHLKMMRLHDQVGILYFHSNEEGIYLSNVEREVLMMFTNLLAQCVVMRNTHALANKYEIINNSLLKHNNSYLYAIDEETHRLTYISDEVKRAYPDMKIGDICYKSFHKNHDTPCTCCPLIHGKSLAVRPELGDNLFISRINYITEPRIEDVILIEPSKPYLEKGSLENMDPDLQIGNAAKLLSAFKQEINEKKGGYVLFINLAEYDDLKNNKSIEIATHVLNVTSKRIQSLGYEDCTYRYSDSVLVLLLKQYKRTEVLNTVEAIAQIIAGNIEIEQVDRSFNFHIGVVGYPSDMNTVESYNLTMQTAIKESSELPLNRLYIFGEKVTRSTNREEYILVTIEDAIKKDLIDVYLQPIMDNQGNEPRGMEALMRLMDPSRGYISPSEFVPIAAKNGLMFEVEQANIRKVGELWKSYGFGLFKQVGVTSITINISVDSLNNESFVERVKSECRKYRFPKKFLQFEVRESILKANFERIRTVMNELSDCNISWSIDNYGLHQLTLDKLKEIHVDQVKIDRAFILDIESNARSRTTLLYMVQMANKLGIKVCIEGIERSEQLAVIKEMNIDYLQGYLFAKAMPVNDAIKFLNFGK